MTKGEYEAFKKVCDEKDALKGALKETTDAWLRAGDARDAALLQIDAIKKLCLDDCKGGLVECIAGDCWPCAVMALIEKPKSDLKGMGIEFCPKCHKGTNPVWETCSGGPCPCTCHLVGLKRVSE
jgi:hypothetical protein